MANFPDYFVETSHKTPFPLRTTFRDESHEELYDALKRQKNVPTPYTYDLAAVQSMDMEVELGKILRKSKSLALTISCGIYSEAVLEFVSSFFCDRHEPDGSPLGWQFRLGNKWHFYGPGKLRDLFGFTTGVPTPQYEKGVIKAFWKQISGREDFEPAAPAKYIREGVWKYVHCLLVNSVNTRSEHHDLVTCEDLELMLAMELGDKINYISLLGSRFEEWKDLSSPRKIIGGSIFVSKIIENEGFLMDDRFMSFKPLNMANLILDGMVAGNQKSWVHESESSRGKKRVRGDDGGSSHPRVKETGIAAAIKKFCEPQDTLSEKINLMLQNQYRMAEEFRLHVIELREWQKMMLEEVRRGH